MTTAPNATHVTDGYAQQIAGDLSANRTAQERARTELQRLQEELGQLEDGEKVLLKMQDALGIPAKPASPQAAKRGTKRAAVPSARSAVRGEKTAAAPSAPTAKSARAGKTAGKTAAKSPAKAPVKAEGKKETGGPSWLELVTAAIVGQAEPKSAAEVAETVSAAHPDRKVQATIIRNTLEQGVARGILERSKQGRSVYYTPVGSAPEAPAAEEPEPTLP
ncbi:hypothetical protein ACFWUW_17125 [Streptomyces sp. NPDC058655]|uniref:hypothetical protein n=1 Tax=unclassified Streptomyces TaxID=2593676 RepID=UPI0036496222